MISTVVRTVLVYCAVTVAMRLMGKRQLGELQPAELVTTLLISNVASICIDEPDLPLLASLVPIFLITALEILNSTLLWFSPAYAELLLGRPVTVIRNGKIQQDALAQLRITVSDLTEALRGRGYFLSAGGLLGRGRTERQYLGGLNAEGRSGTAPAAASHRHGCLQGKPCLFRDG